MNTTHNKLGDRDLDMDDLSPKYMSNHSIVQSIEELKKHHVHACEFCEKMFENRYDYLIHNAKHIIIPQIKMLPHYCSQCCLYFTSAEEFNEHMSNKHKTFVKPTNNINCGTINNDNCETIDNNNCEAIKDDNCKTKMLDRFTFKIEDIKEETNEDENPLNGIIKKEKDMIINEETDNILDNFMMNCKVDVEEFLPPWLYNSDDDSEVDNVIDFYKSNYKNSISTFGPLVNCNYVIKSDDEASHSNEIVLKSSIYNNIIKNEVEKCENPAPDVDSSLELSDLEDDPIIILAPVIDVKTEHEIDSVHFDDLMRPGIFYCNRCLKIFPTRFAVIVHEIVHIYLSRTAPEQNKVKHESHFNSVQPLSGTSKQLKICGCCNEEIFNETLHAKTCSKMYCSGCAKGFDNKTCLKAHEDTCNGEAVVNLCDICLYLRQKPEHIQYYGIIRLNNLEVKVICHWCGKLCDYISIMTITTKVSVKNKIQFEGEEHSVLIPKPRKLNTAKEPINTKLGISKVKKVKIEYELDTVDTQVRPQLEWTKPSIQVKTKVKLNKPETQVKSQLGLNKVNTTDKTKRRLNKVDSQVMAKRRMNYAKNRIQMQLSGTKRGLKNLSNWERLKLIQKRLKLIRN